MADSKTLIVGDIGGTHARFATVYPEQSAEGPRLANIRTLLCRDYASLSAAVLAYLADIETTGSLCVAVPGPVHLPLIPLVNNPWQTLDRRELEDTLAAPVALLNDFTAQAHAIPWFGEADLHWWRGSASSAGTRLIVGPGTGLGVGPLLPCGVVLESEAGHMQFAPATPRQHQIAAILGETLPRVVNESLISGPGLGRLHQALQHLQGRAVTLPAEAISTGAANGDPACQATLDEFAAIFGALCGDLALGLGGSGGLYLSGGLLAGIKDQFDVAGFLEQFDNKGNYRAYCEAIPVARVTHPHPGLLGAAAYACRPSATD